MEAAASQDLDAPTVGCKPLVGAEMDAAAEAPEAAATDQAPPQPTVSTGAAEGHVLEHAPVEARDSHRCPRVALAADMTALEPA